MKIQSHLSVKRNYNKFDFQVEVAETSSSNANNSETTIEKLNDEPAQAIEIVEEKMEVDAVEEAQSSDNCIPATSITNESRTVKESVAEDKAEIIVEKPEPLQLIETEPEILPNEPATVEAELPKDIPLVETTLPAQIIEVSPTPNASAAADTTTKVESSIKIDEPKENDVKNQENNVSDAKIAENEPIEKNPLQIEEIVERNQSSSETKLSSPSLNEIEGSIETNDVKENSVQPVDVIPPASQSNNDGKGFDKIEKAPTGKRIYSMSHEYFFNQIEIE